MFIQSFQTKIKPFHLLFAVGLCLVIAAGWIHIYPSIQTFMFTWRVELAAAIFTAAVSGYLLTAKKEFIAAFKFSVPEIYLIILPMTIFTLWSGVSSFWSFSPRSALEHTAFWSIYLIFYIVARQMIDVHGNYKLVMTFLTVLLVLIASPAIIEYCSYVYLKSETLLGLRFSKYAEIVNLLCPLMIASVVRMEGKRFKIGVLTVTIMSLFIISTISRTGLMLFAAGILLMIGIIFTMEQFKKYRRKMIFLTFILIVSPIPIHLITFLSPDPGVPIVTRLNDPVGMSGSNNARKMLASVALEMTAANSISGVGAGNFGIELNNYRAAYGAQNPQDVNLSANEAQISERTHNEYLQILSELGVVGAAIFLWFLAAVGLMAITLFKKRNRFSLFPFAAIVGITLFLISSAVSSYSFRLMQNGLVFFLVLAVAAKFLLPDKKDVPKKSKLVIPPVYFYRTVFAGGIILCLFLGTNCILRAVSSYYATQLLNLSDAAQADYLYANAVRFNVENPHSYLGFGIHLINAGRYAEAAPELRKAIIYGEGTSATYSLLATAQSLSGDDTAAAESFAEAIKLYPRSTFARTRYADLLDKSGDVTASQNQLTLSAEIDKTATSTWWSLMHEGVAKTNLKTVNNPEYMIVFDLKPTNSYTAFMIERLIRHPEETPKFDFLAVK